MIKIVVSESILAIQSEIIKYLYTIYLSWLANLPHRNLKAYIKAHMYVIYIYIY